MNNCGKNEKVLMFLLNADSASLESIFLYFDAIKAYFSQGLSEKFF